MKYWKDGFYLTPIEGSVEITDEYWDELLLEQSKGKEIVTNGEGFPEAIEYIPPLEEQEMMARLKRDELLRKNVDSLNLIRWELLTEEQKQAWIDYRQALLDVPQQEGFPTKINWPEIPE